MPKKTTPSQNYVKGEQRLKEKPPKIRGGQSKAEIIKRPKRRHRPIV